MIVEAAEDVLLSMVLSLETSIDCLGLSQLLVMI